MWHIVPLPPFKYGTGPHIPEQKVPKEILTIPDPTKFLDEVTGPRPNPWSQLLG